MKMEFAKYYNVTGILNKMLEEKESKLFSYQKDYCQGLYICMDTHDFWVCRILKGYNAEFEQKEGFWLVERNKIDKYDLLDFVQEENDKIEIGTRHSRDVAIDSFDAEDLINHVILYDDDNGLEAWDNVQCFSLEECTEVIDDGYGIIELTV